MGDAIAEARMREFIIEKELMPQFTAWSEAIDREWAELGKPAISIEYTFGYRNSNHRSDINITPWLRNTDLDGVHRFLRCDFDDLINEDHEDHAFLEGVVSELLDEEEQEWRDRCSDTSINLYEVREQVMRNIADLRPADHHLIAPQITVASEHQPSMF